MATVAAFTVLCCGYHEVEVPRAHGARHGGLGVTFRPSPFVQLITELVDTVSLSMPGDGRERKSAGFSWIC